MTSQNSTEIRIPNVSEFFTHQYVIYEHTLQNWCDCISKKWFHRNQNVSDVLYATPQDTTMIRNKTRLKRLKQERKM